MVALLRYRRLPYTVKWGIPAEACEAMGVMDVSMPENTHQVIKHSVHRRQTGRLYVVGSSDTTAAVIDASYRRLLAAMENHLENQKYMPGMSARCRRFRPVRSTEPIGGL